MGCKKWDKTEIPEVLTLELQGHADEKLWESYFWYVKYIEQSWSLRFRPKPWMDTTRFYLRKTDPPWTHYGEIRTATYDSSVQEWFELANYYQVWIQANPVPALSYIHLRRYYFGTLKYDQTTPFPFNPNYAERSNTIFIRLRFDPLRETTMIAILRRTGLVPMAPGAYSHYEGRVIEVGVPQNP